MLPLMFWRTEMILPLRTDLYICVTYSSSVLSWIVPVGETPDMLYANKTDTLLGAGRTLVPNEVN